MIKTKAKETDAEDRGRLVEQESYFVHTGLPKKADGSNLKLWKEIAGRTMTAEDWEAVVEAFKAKRQPPIFKGFKTRDGKEYSSPVEIWMTAVGVRADLSPRIDGTALSVSCPVTKEPLLMRKASNNSPYYIAKGFPGLVMYGSIGHRKITPEEWLEILKAGLVGKAGPEMTFRDKDGNPYKKTLQIVQNEKGKFEVEEQYVIEKTATQTVCPISQQPILESRNCFYSAAFPEMRFPKRFWGREFTEEDVCKVVEATARKTELPRFTLYHKNGDPYEATLSVREDGYIIATPCERQNKSLARTEQTEAQTPARGLSR
jgi:hypothetical protein